MGPRALAGALACVTGSGALFVGLQASNRAPDPVTIDARARAIQPGEIVVLTITLPAPRSAVRVRAFGRDQVAFRDGDRVWRALVGIDLEAAPGRHVVTIEADAVHATYDLDVRRK